MSALAISRQFRIVPNAKLVLRYRKLRTNHPFGGTIWVSLHCFRLNDNSTVTIHR
jgi:hypothetical protein